MFPMCSHALMANAQLNRVVMLLSLRILWDAQACARQCPVDTDAVRLALRCLLPYCPERWPLVTFWDSAGQSQEIGRTQGTSAAYKAILLQLEVAGLRPPPFNSFEPPMLSRES